MPHYWMMEWRHVKLFVFRYPQKLITLLKTAFCAIFQLNVSGSFWVFAGIKCRSTTYLFPSWSSHSQVKLLRPAKWSQYWIRGKAFHPPTKFVYDMVFKDWERNAALFIKNSRELKCGRLCTNIERFAEILFLTVVIWEGFSSDYYAGFCKVCKIKCNNFIRWHRLGGGFGANSNWKGFFLLSTLSLAVVASLRCHVCIFYFIVEWCLWSCLQATFRSGRRLVLCFTVTAWDPKQLYYTQYSSAISMHYSVPFNLYTDQCSHFCFA